MVDTCKNTFRINVTNLIVNLLMTISIAFGILELKDTFSFIDMVAIIYAILYEIMIIVAIYAGIRQLNLPEFMEFLENGYVQLLGFILINLLLIDTSFIGLIIGSVVIAYSLGVSLYLFFRNE
tara:strand:+ start:3432 stop:3800 length:369 start_codon:yes stop_codon:yes gene_type:complete